MKKSFTSVLSLLLILSFRFSLLHAGNLIIIGVVTDPSGKPIPFAEALLPGTGIGTTTDRDGRFLLNVETDKEITLIIQHSAYNTENVVINEDDREVLAITLEPKTYQFNPVIVEGNLYAKERLHLPVSYRLIQMSEFPNSGNSVAEKLDRLGIQVKDYGGAAGLKTIASPTGYGEHILVMLENLPLNSPQNGGFDFSNLPADLFSQGEFYWGQGSSLYGSNAVGGTLNLILDQHRPTYFRIKSGSFGERGLSGKIVLNEGTGRTSIYGNRYENLGDFRENNAFHQESYGGQVTLPLGKLWTARYFALRTEADRGIAGSIQYPSPNAKKKNKEWIQLASIRGLTLLGQTDIYWGMMTSDEHFADPDWSVDSRHRVNAQRVRVVHRFPQVRFFQNTVTLEFARNHVNSDDAGNHKESLAAAGWLTQIPLTPNLYLSPSVRVDFKSESNTSVTTENIALLWHGESNIIKSAYLNSGTSYRNPTFNDLYWQDPSGFSVNNPNLKPERGTSVDLAVEVWPFSSELLQLSVRAYHFFTKNLIQWVPDQNWIYSPRNMSMTESFGISVGVDVSPSNSPLRVRIESEQNRSQVLSEGSSHGMRLLYVPAVSHWSEVIYRTKLADLVCSYRFFGNRRYRYNDQDAILESYDRVDLSLRLRGPSLSAVRSELDLGIRNFQDRKNHQTVYGYPEPGRAVFTRLTVEIR